MVKIKSTDFFSAGNIMFLNPIVTNLGPSRIISGDNISRHEKAYNAYCLVYITTLSIQNLFVDLFLSFGLSKLN